MLAAIFHSSFHPTAGNTIDWSLGDASLDGLEFNTLPSGLHLVDHDVVYFSKHGKQGVSIFRRRSTQDHGHRGVRLSSLSILLSKSTRPRPWRYVAALKELTTLLYSRTDPDWDLARAFFNERNADPGAVEDWNGWSHELLDRPDDDDNNPTLHLPHLLRILGPSSLTLYKHVIGRRRILIYTLPPVEPASILCQVAADMAFQLQLEHSKEGISVLGMVTLNDLDRLRAEGNTGRGWVACTTDAIFLEKPSCYDLLIDLTTSSPNNATRPTFYASRQSASSPTPRLSVVRFSWSDIKLVCFSLTSSS